MENKKMELPATVLEQYEILKKEFKKEKYILELNDIDKIYDNGFQAIFGTTIRIKKGEFLALLGPSGCGKSTTLRMIAGLEKVSQGDIFINAVNVTNAEPAIRDLTMVFQNYALFPHLSVKNNIIFGLKANHKKIGQSGIIYKDINILKSEIKAKENILHNVKSIAHNEKRIENYQKKHQGLLTKFEEALKQDPTLQTKKSKLLRVEISKLESFIDSSKKKIIKSYQEKNNIDKYQKQISELKDKIKKLEEKRSAVAKGENVAQIINDKANEAAKLLGLDYHMDQKPGQLSGGQRQRVALGRSIVGNPTLFLMDEPLSNLDAKLRAKMRQEIRTLHEKINSGTIYVTHDQIEAMTMADQIAVMSDGFILQIGEPNHVYKNPSCLFVASFVGSPEMNLIEGTVKNKIFISNKGFKIPLVPYKLKNVSENQKVLLGIRPTDFSVDDNFLAAYKSKIKVKILAKELLGNDIQYRGLIIDSKKEMEEITFITSSYENYEIGVTREIYPILSRLHIFDKETTISLTSQFNLPTIEALQNWIKSSEKIEIRRELLEEKKQKQDKKGIIFKLIQKMKRKKND